MAAASSAVPALPGRGTGTGHCCSTTCTRLHRLSYRRFDSTRRADAPSIPSVLCARTPAIDPPELPRPRPQLPAMVGKKSGRALMRDEGLERTDNNLDLTTWPQVSMINQKNYYTSVTPSPQLFPLASSARCQTSVPVLLSSNPRLSNQCRINIWPVGEWKEL
ncbi:hypothetical protein B0J12DRAFT_701356 [Macrophomina phaseolina]|uniref:Uncharacterized protein n=1 Tax=Macrophomina phaseolina TaxID=35725 RepID=A0ABQ8G5Q8_9PEZI|nr:hypothetical protein B0J12DRAFT_701356 [Macrophomina phaseolina]